MKKLATTLFILLVCAASNVGSAEIKPSDVTGKPNVYCTLVTEPDPVLLGHYGCVHRKLKEKTNDYTMEPIEYWLVKFGDGYALHFYRVKDGKGHKYKGWRKWYIRGNKITSGGDSTIFTKDGDVYYQWKFNKPTKMTRIE
jgi:hypothetical protein